MDPICTEDGRMCHLELVRQPPARKVRVRDGAARRESPLVLVVKVMAAVVIGFLMMFFCGKGGF